ncbi:cystathionine beta-lyase [Turicimonas sp. TL08]
MSDFSSSISTKLVHVGRNTDVSQGFVNIPPFNGSTVLHHSSADMKERTRRQMNGEEVLTYGTGGGPTHDAFFQLMNELEGGEGTWAYSTGLAGCVIPFFAFVKAGDHVLVTDSVYGPTREFCETILRGLGIEVEFYIPTIGERIEELIRSNTRLIFMESPGSHSFEMQDVPAIVRVAQKHNVWTMIDNTWATPMYFQPLKAGVDVVIHAATKYIGGHSDLLMSTATCNAKAWPLVKAVSITMGQLAPADTIYLAHRGIRTMKVRMEAQFKSAQKIVDWLEQQPEVEKILWPAHEKDPGYPIWKRDFTGAAALFAVKLKDNVPDAALDAFLDNLKLFGLGYSWGGYESLLIRSYGKRCKDDSTAFEKMLRLSIGLEDAEDLIRDLQRGFEALRKEMP